MVATSVTVTTIICYQPASQASLISNLAHNDPGKVVITPSMQLSRGEPLYVDHNDPGKVVCQVATVEGQWWAWQCKWSVLGLLLSTGDHEVYDDSHYMQVVFFYYSSPFSKPKEKLLFSQQEPSHWAIVERGSAFATLGDQFRLSDFRAGWVVKPTMWQSE